MSKPVIVWQDPPPGGRGGQALKYGWVVEALKERPGQWACIQRNEDKAKLHPLMRGLYGKAYRLAARPFRLRTALRQTSSGDWGVWARLEEQT